MNNETLKWVYSTVPSTFSIAFLQHCKGLIFKATGESYPLELIRTMPVDPLIGSFFLIPETYSRQQAMDELQVFGLLWSMRIDDNSSRILTFLIAEEFRGRGLASDVWLRFVETGTAEGILNVSLEVREENDIAYEFYLRRGLQVKGKLSQYYRQSVGVAMFGQLQCPRPQSQ